MNYIDGFVLPIPSDRLAAYQEVATQIADIWLEHGAIDYFEYAGDDMSLAGTQSFLDMMNIENAETVVFGWVVFASREARDLVNKKVAADPRMNDLMLPLLDPDTPVFDASRMAYGGFKMLVRPSNKK